MRKKILKWLKNNKSKCLEKTKLENRFNQLHRSKFSEGDNITNILFHYTDENGLKGIIQSGSLWLTNYKKLCVKSDKSGRSDPLELKIIRDYLNNKVNGDGIENSFKQYFEDHMNNSECYIISFCEDDSNTELWNTYGSNEGKASAGYALGFSEDFFSHRNHEEKIKERGEIRKRGFGHVALKSEYVDPANFNGIIKEYIDTFFKLLALLKGEKRNKCAIKFLKRIYSEIPRYKSLSFQDEKEHRLYTMNSNFQPIPSNFKTSNDQFIFSERVKKSLVKILIGKNASLKEEEVRDLLLISNEKAINENPTAEQFDVENITIYRKKN